MERYLEKVSRPEDLAVAVRAAEAAGEVMNRYGRKESTGADTEEDRKDLVAGAELEAQERIVETISKEFPDDGFRGEEDLQTEGYSRRNWVIDPIDGASNFARGIPFFCTSIGLEVDGKLVLGVVYSPETGMDEMFFGCNGSGAYRVSAGELEEISVSEADGLEAAMTLGRISEISDEDRERDMQLATRILERGARFRRMGSVALNQCLVADGRAEAFLSRRVQEWDYAAAKVILEEAGGETGIEESGDGSFSTLASNGELHRELERIFESYRP